LKLNSESNDTGKLQAGILQAGNIIRKMRLKYIENQFLQRISMFRSVLIHSNFPDLYFPF